MKICIIKVLKFLQLLTCTVVKKVLAISFFPNFTPAMHANALCWMHYFALKKLKYFSANLNFQLQPWRPKLAYILLKDSVVTI